MLPKNKILNFAPENLHTLNHKLLWQQLRIELNNELYSVVEFLHVKPGKGGAFVRTKLKNLKSGKVIPHTFNAGVKINVQRVERRPFQFLYNLWAASCHRLWNWKSPIPSRE